MLELPRPLLWADRAASMPYVPGGQEQQLESLRDLLLSVQADGADPKVVRLVDSTRPKGLVERAGRGAWRVTKEGLTWLETQDHEYLIGVFHAGIRYVGELLEQLDSAALTHHQLLAIANQDYGLDWTSLDQVRRRTTWLRAAGFVELRWDLSLVITDSGRRLLARLDNYRPEEHIDDQAATRVNVELPSAPGPIQALLDGLAQPELEARRRSWGYIPGTAPIIETFRDFVQAATPNIARQAWIDRCKSNYGAAESSAITALSAFRTAGLVEQIDQDVFASTVLARAWLESGADIDLVRIMHAHFRFVGELLKALEVTGNATELAAMAESFNVTSAETQRRLALLRAAGLIEEVGMRRYRLSPIGEATAAALPLEKLPLPADRGPREDPEPPLSRDGAIARRAAWEIGEELAIAARAAQDHKRLELAVASALAALGFQVEHLGGSGRTDVVAVSPLAAGNRFTVIADAKASAKGEVGAFDAVTLREHKETYGADSVIAVGERFSDSRTVGRAKSEGVGLLTTGALAQLVDLASQGLIGVHDLRALFTMTGNIPEEAIVAKARPSQRLNGIAKAVVFALAEEAAANDEVTEGALSALDLYRHLRARDDAPTLNDIQLVLDLVASPFVRGLVKKGEKYSLSDHVGIVAARLRRVGDLLADIDLAD